MRIAFEIVGVPEAAAGIEGGYARVYAATVRQMGVSMLGLRNYAITEHMHGPTGSNTVQQRSGNLVQSLTSETVEDGNGVTGLVGIPEASTAPYARILALGGTTRAHVIEAREGQALAFMVGGQLTFRKRVNHPGSNFPARDYLGSSLAERKAQIRAEITEAILEARA